MRRTIVLLSLTTVAVVLWSGSPAAAQGTDDIDAVVVFTGRAEVGADEELETVVIFDGPAVIEGTVSGEVVAFNGDVRVTGSVDGEVVSLNGRVTVADGGRVGGDVVSQREAVVEPGATVGGEVRRFDPEVFDNWFGVVSRLAWWLAVSVSALVLGLLLAWLTPRLVDATSTASRTATGAVIGWGLAALIGGPIVAVVLMVTLVGIPLGLYLLVTLGVVSILGYTASAWLLGRLVVRQPRSAVLAFLAGLAVLRVLALVPFLGGLVWFGAAVFGTGALAVSAWRARAATTPVAAMPSQP